MKIGVIDYGVCNINAILKMLNLLELDCIKITNIAQLKDIHKIILPGIGSFDNGVSVLKKNNLFYEIHENVVKKGKLILGICLGMQLLGKHSEEGKLMGLNLINANTIKINLNKNSNLKIPHMGWNYIKNLKKNRLISNLPENPRFYFTHSYHLGDIDKKNVVSTVDHGIELVAIINHNNIFGTQFHPEKSHKYGLALLKNFGELNA